MNELTRDIWVLADDCVIVDETERRINTELEMCSETRKLKAFKISYNVTLKHLPKKKLP